MGFHSFDLQSAIYSTLDGDSTLDSLVGNNKVAYEAQPNGQSHVCACCE